MGLMVIEVDEGPHKVGKFPDYLTKSLGKPSFIGGKIKGAYQLGKILYKTGAYKRVMRYYGYRNKYRIATGIIGVGISSSFLQFPSENGQARSNVVQSKSKRRYRRKYCPPRRRTSRR